MTASRCTEENRCSLHRNRSRNRTRFSSPPLSPIPVPVNVIVLDSPGAVPNAVPLGIRVRVRERVPLRCVRRKRLSPTLLSGSGALSVFASRLRPDTSVFASRLRPDTSESVFRSDFRAAAARKSLAGSVPWRLNSLSLFRPRKRGRSSPSLNSRRLGRCLAPSPSGQTTHSAADYLGETARPFPVHQSLSPTPPRRFISETGFTAASPAAEDADGPRATALVRREGRIQTLYPVKPGAP